MKQIDDKKLNKSINLNYGHPIPPTGIANFEEITTKFTRRATNDCSYFGVFQFLLHLLEGRCVSSNPFLTLSKEDNIAIRLFAIPTIISSAAENKLQVYIIIIYLNHKQTHTPAPFNEECRY